MKLLIKIVLLSYGFLFLVSCDLVMKENGYIIDDDDEYIVENTQTIAVDPSDLSLTENINVNIELESNKIRRYTEPEYEKGLERDGETTYNYINTIPLTDIFYENGISYKGYVKDINYNPGDSIGIDDDVYTVRYYYPDYIDLSGDIPNQWYNDEGYIAPKVLKYQKSGDDFYVMWYTQVTKHYFDNTDDGYLSGYSKFIYEYTSLVRTSTDGIVWDKLDLTNDYSSSFNSSVSSEDYGGIIISDVIKNNNGIGYTLYYLAKSTKDSELNGWKMYAAFTNGDEPKNWNRLNPLTLIINLGDGYDSKNISQGHVFYDNGKYNLWYSGSNSLKSSIGYAVSTDTTIFWTKFQAEPVFTGLWGKFDQQGIYDPFVFKDNDIYKMYYSGYDGSNYKLGLAYSENSTDFIYYDTINYKSIDFCGYDVRYPYVIEEYNDENKKFYRVYYSKKVDGVWKICMAETDVYDE